MYFRDEDVSSDKCESSDSEGESDLEFPELYVGPGVNHITSANDVNDVIQNVFMVSRTSYCPWQTLWCP